MKAAIYNQYGGPDVVSVKEIKTPNITDNEVLVNVKASSLTPGDSVMRKGEPYASRLIAGLTKPKNPILGHEFAGEVVATGKNIKKFKVGDRVFGTLGLKSGSHAQYIKVSENDTVLKIPKGKSFVEAAAVPVGTLTALFFLTKGGIQPGHNVLINGASGSIGTYAVQLSKFFGAEVTGVSSSRNKDLVLSIGADNYIDYTKVDVYQSGQKYDLIFDTVGKLDFSSSSKSLKDGGKFVTTAVKASLFVQMAQSNISGKRNLFTGVVKENIQDLQLIAHLLEEEMIYPIIDRTYSLEEITMAHAYVDSGHKKGNVIITPN